MEEIFFSFQKQCSDKLDIEIGNYITKVIQTFRTEMINSLKGITENPRQILGRLRKVPEYEDPPISDVVYEPICRSIMVTLFKFDKEWDGPDEIVEPEEDNQEIQIEEQA